MTRTRRLLLVVLSALLVPATLQADNNLPEPGQEPWPKGWEPEPCEQCHTEESIDPETGRRTFTYSCVYAGVTVPDHLKGTSCTPHPNYCEIGGGICYYA